jgi:hypothetical protein
MKQAALPEEIKTPDAKCTRNREHWPASPLMFHDKFSGCCVKPRIIRRNLDHVRSKLFCSNNAFGVISHSSKQTALIGGFSGAEIFALRVDQ